MAVTAQEGSSGDSPDGSSQRRVAAILAGAGLDPAELQQQRPNDYSRLTLLLAQVLAQVHTARVARAVGTLHLHPAELMTRICFLAFEVGLAAGDLERIVQRHLDSLRFDIESARGLLSWLQGQQVSTRQLRLASRSFPGIWSVDVKKIQRSKQHLQQRLAVKDSQWAEAFAANPLAARAGPEVVDGVVAWLEAEPLGFSRPEVAQLWRSSPLVFAIPVATLQRNLQGLLSRCPMDKLQLRTFMRGSCCVFTQDFDTVVAKLDSLLAELPGLAPRLANLIMFSGSLLALSRESVSGKLAYLQAYGKGLAGC